MGDLIDLDEYRKRRTAEGTWPPDEATVKEYWRKHLPKKKPEYNGPANTPTDPEPPKRAF